MGGSLCNITLYGNNLRALTGHGNNPSRHQLIRAGRVYHMTQGVYHKMQGVYDSLFLADQE